MRLWHQYLIPYLPRQQLLGQHRECCALRGNGWGKPHSTVDYVFKHPYMHLAAYHMLILQEYVEREYNPDPKWFDPFYRGKSHAPEPYLEIDLNLFKGTLHKTKYMRQNIYREHNGQYLAECINNLAGKGIQLPLEPFLLEGTVVKFVDPGTGSLCVTSPLYGTKGTIEHVNLDSAFPYAVKPHMPGWDAVIVCCNKRMVRAVKP